MLWFDSWFAAFFSFVDWFADLSTYSCVFGFGAPFISFRLSDLRRDDLAFGADCRDASPRDLHLRLCGCGLDLRPVRSVAMAALVLSILVHALGARFVSSQSEG